MSNRVSVTIDGVDYQVEESALLGHVLHDVKNAGFRLSPKTGEPRGLYCSMGVCFDCLGKHRWLFRFSSLFATGA